MRGEAAPKFSGTAFYTNGTGAKEDLLTQPEMEQQTEQQTEQRSSQTEHRSVSTGNPDVGMDYDKILHKT